MTSLLLVGLGGFIGAAGRYAVSKIKFTKAVDAFPWATFIVNILGSFILALLCGLNSTHTIIHNNYLLFLGTGMLGSFTTFSTFSLESLQLIKTGQVKLYILYVSSSVLLGVMFAIIGFLLGYLLS